MSDDQKHEKFSAAESISAICDVVQTVSDMAQVAVPLVMRRLARGEQAAKREESDGGGPTPQ